MSIRPLVCPLNNKSDHRGAITTTFYSNYKLTIDEIILFEKLSWLPKPERKPKEDNERDIL